MKVVGIEDKEAPISDTKKSLDMAPPTTFEISRPLEREIGLRIYFISTTLATLVG